MGNDVARMEEGNGAFKVLTGKPTGKRPLERFRRRWVDNTRMNSSLIGSPLPPGSTSAIYP